MWGFSSALYKSCNILNMANIKCETHTSCTHLLIFCPVEVQVVFQIIFRISWRFKARQAFIHALCFFLIFWSSDRLPSLCKSVLEMKCNTGELEHNNSMCLDKTLCKQLLHCPSGRYFISCSDWNSENKVWHHRSFTFIEVSMLKTAVFKQLFSSLHGFCLSFC